MLRSLLSKRYLHGILLAVAALAIIFPLQESISTRSAVIIGITPAAAWYLGQQYERALVLEAGAMDEDDLSLIERNAATLFKWQK